MPPRGRLDQGPDPDGGFDLKRSFEVLIGSTDALQQAVADQTEQIRAQINIERMMTPGGHEGGTGHMAAMQYQPQMRPEVLRSLARTGGMPVDPTMGMTKISGLQAGTSLQAAQAWAAQRFGQAIANRWGTGEQLYEPHAPGEHAEAAGNAVHTPPGAPANAQPGGVFQPTIGQAIAGLQSDWRSEAGTGGAAILGSATSNAVASGIQRVASAAAGTGTGNAAGTGGQPPATPPTTAQQFWQNVGARVAASGGSGGVLGILKHVPVLGGILGAAEGIRNVYSEQREAGRVYQETEGGTNLGAQTERAHAFAYQASMFGALPEGAAAQMFGDVTGMGFTQRAVGQGQQLQNRQSALDFMYHQYNATGTSVEQSAQILETVSQNASISLKSVSDAMTTMSDTAGKAGVNAKEVRDNFDGLLQTMIKMGGGPGSAQLAGAVATTQAGYGKAFQGTSFAGQLGAGEQYMLSGQYGITPAQAQFIQQLPGMDQGKLADLQSMIQQAGGGAQVKAQPDLATSIGNQFLNKYQPTEPAMDMNVWAQFLGQVTGIKLDPGNVMAWIVDQVAGNTVASNANVGAPGGAKGGGGGGAGAPVSARQAGKAGAGGAATGQYGLAQASQTLAGRQVINKTWQQVLQGGGQGGAAGVYLGQEKKSGQRSPVLEALLQNLPSGAQAAVQTASGVRVMSVQDAMKYYPDEMAAGNVQFYTSNGQSLGSTATVTQGLTDQGAQQGSASEAAAKAKAGKTLGQAHVGTARGADVKQGVTVDLSNEARQLLKLLPSNSDNAAAAATVPQNPYTVSPSR